MSATGPAVRLGSCSGVGPYRLVALRDRPSPRSSSMGGYRQVAQVEGTQSWTAARPYPVRVVPPELLR